MKPKKAQMQMMETMGVLFIFLMLVLFSIIFYYKYQGISLEEKQEELVAARAMDTTLKLLFLPELQCSRGEAEAIDNCIDLMKLRSLDESMEEYLTEYYFNLFSYANISVHMVYPSNKVWSIYDRQKTKLDDDGEQVRDWTYKEPTYFVVTLMDEVHGDPDGDQPPGLIISHHDHHPFPS